MLELEGYTARLGRTGLIRLKESILIVVYTVNEFNSNYEEDLLESKRELNLVKNHFCIRISDVASVYDANPAITAFFYVSAQGDHVGFKAGPAYTIRIHG